MPGTLKGRFHPKNPNKYKGSMLIEFRSSWELAFMNYLDNNDEVIQWSSEEKAIWYYDPVSKKNRRYFPDFIIKYRRSDGIVVEEVVEIKPQRQVDGPPTNPKRKTQAWAKACMTYAINQAKWRAAREWCEDRGMNFRLLTENDVPQWKGWQNRSK